MVYHGSYMFIFQVYPMIYRVSTCFNHPTLLVDFATELSRSEVPLNLSTGEQGSKGGFWWVGDWDFDGF